MNKAEICGAAGNALEQVVDPTTTLRYVRKPDMQPCWLTVWTADDGTLIVEIDGEKVSTHPLKAKCLSRIALKDLVPPRFSLRSLVKPLGMRGGTKTETVKEPSEFTVFIRRGDEDGALLGTYSFKLMTESAFDAAFDKYVRRNDSRPEPSVHTNDERSPVTTHNCWNCQKPLAEGTCCDKCGCPQEDEPETEPESK